ncbi:SGNH/GDSL hydrolase family protein [Rhodococcus chondri]|uniref:SGNH/GDSL hydrolase family protein n=1 Tax=Rhodococcus chondri TaxID=3065941 RepID=A0ABU7JQX2_9NOCA|nr:SGNH/GDSL hydrolase family protein [Rhodococcus sp. CC-R104]MEE2032434.1 SGNH/GDSL hydrolase family protein [Rhodococcus sp. CC-R104]
MTYPTPMMATSRWTEATDPMCLPPHAQTALLVDATWTRYAVMGDSIAEGTGDASPGYTTSPWADRVAAALRTVHPDLDYLNTGRMGATSGRVVETQLSTVLEFGPDLIHITCGSNDLWSPEADLRRTADNLELLFSAAYDSGATVTTLTLADAFVGEDMLRMRDGVIAVNELVRNLAAKYGAVLLDLWNHPLRLRPELLSADRIHFTMNGHAVLASEMVRALHDRLIRSADAKS